MACSDFSLPRSRRRLAVRLQVMFPDWTPETCTRVAGRIQFAAFEALEVSA